MGLRDPSSTIPRVYEELLSNTAKSKYLARVHGTVPSVQMIIKSVTKKEFECNAIKAYLVAKCTELLNTVLNGLVTLTQEANCWALVNPILCIVSSHELSVSSHPYHLSSPVAIEARSHQDDNYNDNVKVLKNILIVKDSRPQL